MPAMGDPAAFERAVGNAVIAGNADWSLGNLPILEAFRKAVQDNARVLQTDFC